MTQRKPYSTDVSNPQWAILEPLIPAPKTGGRPRTVDMREIINAIFYILASGCAWRLMPHDLPPWSTVYHYFRAWRLEGTWLKMNQVLREQVRTQVQKEETPSAAIKDKFPRLEKIFADGGYQGEDFHNQVQEDYDLDLEVVKRNQPKGFKVLPWRWIVERTFAWFMRYRRLTIDYEVLPETAESFIYAAMVQIMVRRLA